MAEIFGVAEELWCSVLIEVLKQLEVRKKERDKKGDLRPGMSAPTKLLSVEHTFDRLDVIAYLDGDRPSPVFYRSLFGPAPDSEHSFSADQVSQHLTRPHHSVQSSQAVSL
jgi:hypothetical protein